MRNKAQCAGRSATFALAVALLISTLARPAGAQPKAPLPDWPVRSNSAASGTFAVAQFATADADRFMAEWRKPTPGVHLQGTTQVRRGRPITTFITFRGCRADKAGKCNVTARFELRAPAGKIDSYPAMEVWANQPQPAGGLIHLSTQSLTMIFSADDPVGIYTVRAAVTDHVAGMTLHTHQDLAVTN